MNGINWSPNVDMLTVGEEGGEEEEVEYNDAFSLVIFWHFFVWLCLSFNNILSYSRLVLLITIWQSKDKTLSDNYIGVVP